MNSSSSTWLIRAEGMRRSRWLTYCGRRVTAGWRAMGTSRRRATVSRSGLPADRVPAAVKMTRLSCHRFRANEVRLWLSLIAYNLGNLWRRLALPSPVANWSLTSLQQRLVKTGGRPIQHTRYYWLLLAGSHLTRRL